MNGCQRDCTECIYSEYPVTHLNVEAFCVVLNRYVEIANAESDCPFPQVPENRG